MKLFCSSCQVAAEIIAKPAGPGLKACCGLCGRYIKFLDRDERLALSGGSRPDREDVLAIARRLAPEDQQWLGGRLKDPTGDQAAPTKLKTQEKFGRSYKNILPPLKKKQPPRR